MEIDPGVTGIWTVRMEGMRPGAGIPAISGHRNLLGAMAYPRALGWSHTVNNTHGIYLEDLYEHLILFKFMHNLVFCQEVYSSY